MKIDLSHKNISRNVLATVFQVLVGSVVFFVLYRYLYDKLGVEKIGVWSLVLAATSVSRIGELGLSAGVVKFVAEALGQGDTTRAMDIIQTIAITLAVFMALLLAVGYPLFPMWLSYFLPEHGVPVALEILPYALLSLWATVIVSVFSGGLDGCMRMDLRSFLTTAANLLYLGLAILLVPKYGLKGVAIAQLIQAVILMIILWCALRTQLKDLPVLPLQWNYSTLKEMFSYGVNFQIIAIIGMLFDPMVKAMMSKFGGLEALGFYQMANRLILQGRALIVEASRVMVPTVSALQEYSTDKSRQLFITSYKLTFYVSVLSFGVLGAFITSICLLWLGHYQIIFIQFALLLNLGWFANTLIGPAYFSNLGSGKLKPNMISQAIMVVSSLLAGCVLGLSYGGIGVVFGVVFGLIAGSMFLLISSAKSFKLKGFASIVPPDMVKLLVLALFAATASNYVIDWQYSNVVILGSALLCSIPILALGWLHSARMMLLRGVKQ